MKKLLSIIVLLGLIGPAYANTCTIRQAGATDQTVYITLLDATTGIPTAGLAFNSSGIDLEYVRTAAAAVDITEATQTAAGAHSDGGFVSVGHGRYRLDLPDAAVAAGVPEVVIQGIITGYIVAPCSIALSPTVNTVAVGGTAQTGRDIGASVLLSSGTGTGQLSLSSGAVLLQATQTGVTIPTVTTVGTATNLTNLPTIPSNWITAAGVANDAIGATEIADGALDNATFGCSGGSFLILGITDCGTAQSASATTLVLRSAAAFGDDTNLGSTLLVNGSTQGYAQPALVSDYVGSTDTATVPTWAVTPSGTITYYQFGTASSAGGGGGASAADVWAYGTRTLTALDEDTTTMDLNATVVGSLAMFDEDSTTIDINATTIGTVTTATNLTNLPTIPSNWLTAAGTATDFTTEVTSGLATASALTTHDNKIGTVSNLGSGATLAANLADIEGQTDDIGVAGAGLTVLATAAALSTVNGFLDTEMAAVLAAVDTEVAAILADTNELQVDWVNGGRLDLLIDSIKAKTDPMTYTSTNYLQVDVQKMNTVDVLGTGTAIDPWNGE